MREIARKPFAEKGFVLLVFFYLGAGEEGGSGAFRR